MLKSLHKDDTQTTPFVVTKDWELSNVDNGDLILMEHSGSDGLPVALEYLEYSAYYPPVTASGCNIALEQQSLDLVNERDGLNVKGLFYPNTDPQNNDGTYQRMVYSQVSGMFYNNYRDPTKIWGTEKIDFDLSKTKRFITDKFKLLDIPKNVFGDKMEQNSIILYDTTTDNNYIITDDGNCNLFAGTNLFSKQQELGEYLNMFASGSDSGCDYYNTISLPDPPILFSYIISGSSTCDVWNNIFIPYGTWGTPWGYCGNCFNYDVGLGWNDNDWPITQYVLQKSLDGITYTISESFNGYTHNTIDNAVSASTTYWYRMYAQNLFGTSSFSNVISQSIPTSSIVWNNDQDVWNAVKACGPTDWDGS